MLLLFGCKSDSILRRKRAPCRNIPLARFVVIKPTCFRHNISSSDRFPFKPSVGKSTVFLSKCKVALRVGRHCCGGKHRFNAKHQGIQVVTPQKKDRDRWSCNIPFKKTSWGPVAKSSQFVLGPLIFPPKTTNTRNPLCQLKPCRLVQLAVQRRREP